MKFASDDFELFGVPRRFAQERSELDTRWRSLQTEVHPDRFVTEGVAAQRLAMQWSVRVNEAYQRLRDPLKRAAYLCELLGAPINAENNTAMPIDFLERQMEWREALAEADGAEPVERLADEVAAFRRAALSRLQVTLDEQHDAVDAARQVRALMFTERFADDVDQRIEAMSR